MRWRFCLTDRTDRNPFVAPDLISNLMGRRFDVAVKHTILVGLCDRGLAQARQNGQAITEAVASVVDLPVGTEIKFMTREEMKCLQ